MTADCNSLAEIHLVPCLNPDGFTNDTRNNANDEDLNRGFPGWRDVGKSRYAL
jgi:murein tripeptide amidase MpaA